ncbi:MAG: hypothetical protein I3274_04175 [Candidatus Moeniiplasma glomeromycotorum]|nr:hypothetical protein [Candidatus Moeniiplasma glomeromycotorum]MCE8167876.1 hypothetical protein [Candidatus Moeniiplasma glomeromycotorum]
MAKIYHGNYSREDYRDWGKEGGRPRKFINEAEKKRFYRQQKALVEGRELRDYRSYKKVSRKTEIQTKIDPDYLKGKHKCPKCGRLHKIFSSGTVLGEYIKFREGLERKGGIVSCESCGYQYPFEKKRVQETTYQAGSGKERTERFQAKKDEESEEEEEEE